MEDNKDKFKHIRDIKENYRRMEEEFVTQLNYEINNHHGTAGGNREEIWKSFFKRIIPKKFNIARSVFIIDSNGNVSKEVDLAIYDEQYTPYIFNYGLIKFIPIEAVSAVVQCKSYSIKKEDLQPWVKSIDSLNTSKESIVRIVNRVHFGDSKDNMSIQTATKPIKILCYLNKEEESKVESTSGRDLFDIVIKADQKITKDENENISIVGKKLNIKFEDKDLFEVLIKYNLADKEDSDIREMEETQNTNFKEIFGNLKNKELKNYEIKDTEDENYSLLSFIFQFNQMLMMINNPMFFPHIAYVNMFNKYK